MAGAVTIGTSGWSYPHWRGVFYPEDLPPEQCLRYYAGRFRSVEINNTFYQLPPAATMASWRDAVPQGFVFAVKASNYITHRKKLQDADAAVTVFLERVALLGDKLGPILFQLPPRFHSHPERLEHFLSRLPADRRYAFELRDPSWFEPRVESVLRRYGAAAVIYEFDWRLSPMLVTAPFVYVRLHGPEGAYRGRYGRRGLLPWARRIRRWQAEGLDVYCYFDNDQAGYATMDALELLRLVGTPPSA